MSIDPVENPSGYERGMGLVYAIINDTERAVYIGLTRCSLRRRISNHANELRGGRHRVKSFQDAFDRCGADAFRVEVLEIGPGDVTVFDREAEWMNRKKIEGWTLYNANKASYQRIGRHRTPRRTGPGDAE